VQTAEEEGGLSSPSKFTSTSTLAPELLDNIILEGERLKLHFRSKQVGKRPMMLLRARTEEAARDTS
jgi:hypothetical protein